MRLINKTQPVELRLDGSETMLYQITPHYACFGIEIKGAKVIDAAPIGKWMIGKSFVSVAEWVNKKGGTIKIVDST